MSEQDRPGDRSEEPNGEHRSAHGGACVERKPEPCVERRQHEDERVGLEHGKTDGDDSERGQCDDEAREPLVGCDRPGLHEVPTGDEPAENERRQQNEDTEDRGVVEERRVRRQRERRAGREDADDGPDRHQQAAECPHTEPRALRTEGWLERKRTPTTANDQVDEAERERDDTQNQRQARGPATRSAAGEEEAVGCAKRSPDARVE